MAEQMAAQREVTRLEKEINEHEGYAGQALEKGDEALALAVAEKIANLESSLAAQQQAHDSLQAMLKD